MIFVLKHFLGWAILPVLLAAMLMPSEAYAGCTDTPAPGVNWKRCSLDNRNFQNADLSGADLRSAFFARSDFTGSNLTGIDGRRTKFVTAVFNNTRFE